MLTFHTAATQQRRARTELDGGVLVTPYECPERVDLVLEHVHASSLVRCASPMLSDSRRFWPFMIAAMWTSWPGAGTNGAPWGAG